MNLFVYLIRFIDDVVYTLSRFCRENQLHALFTYQNTKPALKIMGQGTYSEYLQSKADQVVFKKSTFKKQILDLILESRDLDYIIFSPEQALFLQFAFSYSGLTLDLPLYPNNNLYLYKKGVIKLLKSFGFKKEKQGKGNLFGIYYDDKLRYWSFTKENKEIIQADFGKN